MSVAPWKRFKCFEYALKVLKILHAYITTDTLPDFLLPDLPDLPDLPEFGNQTSPYHHHHITITTIITTLSS